MKSRFINICKILLLSVLSDTRYNRVSVVTSFCVVEPILPRVRSSYSILPITLHPPRWPPRGSKLKWQWGQIRRVAKNAYPCHRPISNESHDAIANLSPSASFFSSCGLSCPEKWKCLKRDDASAKSPTPSAFIARSLLEKFSSNRSKPKSCNFYSVQQWRLLSLKIIKIIFFRCAKWNASIKPINFHYLIFARGLCIARNVFQ